MIKENIVLPRSILLDQRRYTYQERVFIYFWASRSLSHEFNFSILSYAAFRGFPVQSCVSNLRAVLRRLHMRDLLKYKINKESVWVMFDPSFNLDQNSSTVYMQKNEINALSSVVALRIFELLCSLDVHTFCAKIPVESFKNMVGVQSNMYGTNSSFFVRIVKASLKNINENTKIRVQGEFDGENIILYAVSKL